MGGSYVLKDQKGRPSGYLMQSLGRVRCRADGLPDTARIVLLYDGGREAHAMPADGSEHEWTDGGRRLTGGYIEWDGTLLMTSGQGAREAFYLRGERRREAARPAMAPEARTDERFAVGEYRQGDTRPADQPVASGQPDPAAQPVSRTESRETLKSAQAERDGGPAWPERRWPPPPCWPGARYRDGQWQAPLT